MTEEANCAAKKVTSLEYNLDGYFGPKESTADGGMTPLPT